MNDLNNIFSHSHCLGKEQLLGYLSQSLDQDEVYLVETHLNDCQFCSDAIDGLMDNELPQIEQDFKDLKFDFSQKLRVYEQTNTPKIVVERNELKVSKSNSYKWLAAASVLLLIGLGGYSVFSYIKSQKQEMAMKNESKEGKNVPAEYNLPDKEEAGEIVHLEVKPEDLTQNTTESKTDLKENKSVPAIANSKVVIGKLSTPKQDIAIPKKEVSPTKTKDIVAYVPPLAKAIESKQEAEKSTTQNVNESIASADNYAEEKQIETKQKEVIAKTPAGRMKRNTSNQSPVVSPSNQLNYPAQRNESNVNNDNIAQASSSNLKDKDSKKLSLDSYEQGMQFYNQGDYKKSIKFLEKALGKTDELNKEDVQYHLAQAYLKQGKTEKAIQLFTALSNGKKYKNLAIEELGKLKVITK